jgi:hypothetical protein
VSRATENMQKLNDLREGILVEIRQRERDLEALRNKLRGIDAAIAAVGGGSTTEPKRRNRRNVKKTAMDLIVEAGSAGVTANEIVDRASIAGRHLDRGSISSLLSRLKREGVLVFNGERYFLAGNRSDPLGLKVVGG